MFPQLLLLSNILQIDVMKLRLNVRHVEIGE